MRHAINGENGLTYMAQEDVGLSEDAIELITANRGINPLI
jgi:hypothetical protein